MTEVEDGMGWGGLVESKAEREARRAHRAEMLNHYANGLEHGRQDAMRRLPTEREVEKAATEDMTYRGRLQALLFDLWRDEVLSEQQCAKYHGVDLVSMRRIFDCEAARRGLKDRMAPS